MLPSFITHLLACMAFKSHSAMPRFFHHIHMCRFSSHFGSVWQNLDVHAMELQRRSFQLFLGNFSKSLFCLQLSDLSETPNTTPNSSPITGSYFLGSAVARGGVFNALPRTWEHVSRGSKRTDAHNRLFTSGFLRVTQGPKSKHWRNWVQALSVTPWSEHHCEYIQS